MSLVSLPTIAENQFAAYLSANLSGISYDKTTPDGIVTATYNVAKGFSVEPYELPLIVVKAGRFTELEPWTHVYDGTLAITIHTQIDDCEDPIAVHDKAVAAVYDLMSDQAAVATAVNATNFHLHNYYSTVYDQDITDADNKRALFSVIEYKITAQTLGLS